MIKKLQHSWADDRGYPMENRCGRWTKKSIGVSGTVHRGKRFTNLDIFPEFFDKGHSLISSLNDPKIKIEYLDESKVMLEAQACFSILYLPIKYDQYDDFKKFVNTSLQLGCEGYGNI